MTRVSCGRQVKDILKHLKQNKVELPAGGFLTPERFLQLGLALGGAGGFESLHYLVESAFDPNGELAYSFLREVIIIRILAVLNRYMNRPCVIT